MTFDVPFFVAAIVLLCAPLPYRLGRGQGYAMPGRASAPTMFGVFCAWQNWVDLLRSLAGCWLLFQDKTIVVDVADGRASANALYLRVAILAGSVLIHSMRFGGGLNIYTPVCFLSGLTVLVPASGKTDIVLAGFNCGSKEGWFAMGFAWAFALGLRNPIVLLPAMGVALAAAGYLLSGMNLQLQLGIGLVFLPLVLALLTQKKPQIVSRERSIVKARQAKATAPKTEQGASGKSMDSSTNILK